VKITCLAARLGDPRLGLSSETYVALARRVSTIVHAAWAVNFVGGLGSFEADHIRGVHNLLSLTYASSSHAPTSFYFCSSGATVLGYPPTEPIPEAVPTDPASAAPIGYARSKWVAEHLCAAAWAGPLHGRVAVLRVGQLCGDTRAGVWNEAEGWPLMLRTVDSIRQLPALGHTVVWLPVDVAATAIMDVVVAGDGCSPLGGGCPVFHVMSPNATPWANVLAWMSDFGKRFETVAPDAWVRAVEYSEPDVQKNPSRKLLGLWKKLVRRCLPLRCLSLNGIQYEAGAPPKPEPAFAMEQTLKVAPGLKTATVDGTLMRLSLERWTETGSMSR
jgi:thioester reductase-like protein